MKCAGLFTSIVAITLGIFIPQSLLAEDAATLYKSKCAICHAPDGSGRKIIKGSNLLNDEVKKRTDTQLAEAIAKGGVHRDDSHAFEKKGITSDQVNLLVGYIRELQKKMRK